MAGLLQRTAPGNGRFFVSSSRGPRRPTGCAPGGTRTSGRRSLFAIIAATVPVLLLVVAGCSSSDPRIMQTDYRIIAVVPPDGGEVAEYLRLSVDIADPDGEGEVESISVSIPEQGIFWNVPHAALSVETRDGQTWYTTPHLSVAGSGRFPRGSAEITVIDLSGREDRRSIAIPLTLPEATVDDAITFDAASGAFRLPGSDGTYLIGYRRGEGQREVRELVDAGTAVSVDVIAEQIVRAGNGPRRSDGGDRDAGAELTIWGIVEWSPLLWIESGPWTIDPQETGVSASQ